MGPLRRLLVDIIGLLRVPGTLGKCGHDVGRSAKFDSPFALAVAKDGTIFVCDTNNHVIKVVSNGGG